MHWKLKAAVARLISRLPSGLSRSVYYATQRTVGALRTHDALAATRGALRLVALMRRAGQDPAGKTVCEVGTGWRLGLPLAFYLSGAQRVITVDVNRYLKTALVAEHLKQLSRSRERVISLFGQQGVCPDMARVNTLLDGRARNLEGLLRETHIEYLAPADAACLHLPPGSVDCQVSTEVLEHIPPGTLESILRESRRILAPNGLCVHRVDLSDHFAHGDRSISALNFLRFTEDEWSHYAGNCYQYQNRLRIDDYLALFRSTGLEVISVEPQVDEPALEGLVLDRRFATKLPEINATVRASIVASPGAP